MIQKPISKDALLILISYHHKNTEKVARVIARSLNASIVAPQDVHIDELAQYRLIGFGSGIYDAMHHRALLELADMLPAAMDQNVFLFSTSAIMGENKVRDDHSKLREKLQSKGYTVVDEFACKGFNTNSFLRYFGGMNKGRPNADDLARADSFANGLKKHIAGP